MRLRVKAAIEVVLKQKQKMISRHQLKEKARHCEAAGARQAKRGDVYFLLLRASRRRGNPVAVKFGYSRRMFSELGCFGRVGGRSPFEHPMPSQ